MEIISLATAGQIIQRFHDSACNGIVITSQQAIAGLETAFSLHSHPTYVVGEATAEIARSIGFNNIVTASGTAESLVDVIPTGTFLYLRGEDVAVDITLRTRAHLVELVTYRARLTENPAPLADLLEQYLPDFVLLYSARSAQGFEKLLDKRQELIASFSAVAISAKVAASLKGSWKHVAYSATPDEVGMLKILESPWLSPKQA